MRFELLGEVRVLRDGRPVDLGPAKQRAVLAALLLAGGRPVPTGQLVDAVWGEEPPENGANVVQKYVAGLRRVLDPGRAPRTPGELLALTGSGYVLRIDGASLDTADFEQATTRAAAEHAEGRLTEAAETLKAGLALWRGEALAGLGGATFAAARTRLADAHATAWESWAEVELALGRGSAAIPELARLAAEFPLREGLRTAWMIALYQSGRQAEALAVFRDARRFLVEEFGAEPGDRMQEVHQRILRGEQIHRAAVDPWAGRDPTTLQAYPATVTGPPPYTPPHAPPPTTPYAAPTPPPTTPYAAPPPYAPPVAPSQRPPTDDLPPTSGAPGAVPPVWMIAPRRSSAGQIVLAVALPLFSCSALGWVYFVIVGVRDRRPRQFLVAALYALLAVAGTILLFIDPSPREATTVTDAEAVGLIILFGTWVASAVHGGLTASRSGGSESEWALREQIRRFAALEPVRAVQLGVGRPDLPRPFDDGLIDINRVPDTALARAARLPVEDARRIVADRAARGPFQQPEDLLYRGLVTPGTMRRLAPVLVAIP